MKKKLTILGAILLLVVAGIIAIIGIRNDNKKEELLFESDVETVDIITEETTVLEKEEIKEEEESSTILLEETTNTKWLFRRFWNDGTLYAETECEVEPNEEMINDMIADWEYHNNSLVEIIYTDLPSVDLYFKPNEVATESAVTESAVVRPQENVDVSKINDVYELAYALYGISELDVSRMLKLCTYEGYGADPTLDMYCCMCMVNRVIEGYWGYGNIYNAFGEIDWQYGTWMDSLGIADHAYSALWNALMYLDRNVRYCNGLQDLSYAIYASDVYYGFGVWY